jgi:hypothetical protein
MINANKSSVTSGPYKSNVSLITTCHVNNYKKFDISSIIDNELEIVIPQKTKRKTKKKYKI